MEEEYSAIPENFHMRILSDKNKKSVNVADEPEVEPTTADGNKEIADRYINNGHVHEAITRYKKAARMDNTSGRRTDLGDAYAYAELSVNALKQYRRAIKSNPNDPEPYFSLAEVYGRYGKWHSAIEQYQKAIELSPSSSFYRYKLASAYICTQSYQDAIAQMVQAVACSPNDPFYHYELALMYADNQQNQEAVDELKQAVDLANDDDYYYARLAMLYVRIGEMQLAIDSISESIRINPQKDAYKLLLSYIYQMMGKEIEPEIIRDSLGNLSKYDEDFINRARRYMQGDKW